MHALGLFSKSAADAKPVLDAIFSYLSSIFSDVALYLSNTRNGLITIPGTDTRVAVEDAKGIGLHTLSKRIERGSAEFAIFACLIPVLVILSGIFAGLTLGYMSLDETQLNVLSVSGTPKQREYANKIKPIRKNGHLLLVTLLLANMITNETLPVIADPILGGGVLAVVVSTALIVLFAEIIPQSICTRHGLWVGAKMAGVVRVLIWTFGIVAWPVAKLLEFMLGPHHGIIYRRAELKELIAMHGSSAEGGGDLRTDTITIIGATLDLQDKTVKMAMTPIDKVFMLHVDARLDYKTLRKICSTGHSRIPVYEEVEVDAAPYATSDEPPEARLGKKKMKKIIGILLVKQCVLLDPEDAVPVRKMRLLKVPYVPQNEPLLGILDRFQEGRSHMAIVSRVSVERAQSVKETVRKGLTQRLLGALHGDSSDESSKEDDDETEDDDTESDVEERKKDKSNTGDSSTAAGEDKSQSSSDKGKESPKVRFSSTFKGKSRSRRRKRAAKKEKDLEKGSQKAEKARSSSDASEVQKKQDPPSHTHNLLSTSLNGLEQSMPADAVLPKSNFRQHFLDPSSEFGLLMDPSLGPLGIITLEDVLEELIGEEIYDEFDKEADVGAAHSESFVPPGAHPAQTSAEVVGPTMTATNAVGGWANRIPGINIGRPTIGIGGRRGLTRKNSAPELSPVNTIEPPTSGAIQGISVLPVTMADEASGDSVHPSEASQAAYINAPASTATRMAPSSKPLMLPSLRNLGFLRSRSAPPTPRDGPNAKPRIVVAGSGAPTTAAAPSGSTSAGIENTPSSSGVVTPINTSAVNVTTAAMGIGQGPFSAPADTIPEGQVVGLSAVQEQEIPPLDSKDASEQQHDAGLTTSPAVLLQDGEAGPVGATKQPTQSQAHTIAGSKVVDQVRTAPNSRSASPAPSLEAILHSAAQSKRRGLPVSLGLTRMGSTASNTSGRGGPSASLDSSTAPMSGNAVAGAAVGERSSTSSASERGRTRGPKGTAFKSSPLAAALGNEDAKTNTSVEGVRDANVVIADELRRDKMAAREREREGLARRERDSQEEGSIANAKG